MYKALIDLAKLHNVSPIKNRKTKVITAYVLLDLDGNYQGIDYIDKNNRKQTLIPDFGTAAATANQPNPIVETVEHIFYRNCRKYPFWVETMHNAVESDYVCESLSILWIFINQYDTDDDFANRVMSDINAVKLKLGDMVSFKIDGKPIEEYTDWHDWVDGWVDNFQSLRFGNKVPESVISCVTGDEGTTIANGTFPMIKNVPNDIKAAFGVGAGLYITSIGEKSYESYGFDGSFGSQLTIDDANNLVAGFEFLLNNPDYNNKDFKLLYWYDDKDAENIILEALSADSDELSDSEREFVEDIFDTYKENSTMMSKILTSVRTGKEPILPNDNIQYNIVQFNAPTRGRFYLSYERLGYCLDLYRALYKWYDDTHIIVPYKGIEQHYSLRKFYAILLQCIDNLKSLHSSKDVETQFGKIKTDLLDAIYYNKQIPYVLYRQSLLHVVGVMNKGESIRKVWIQLIKAYLIRKGYNIMPELSTENNTVAYACGRLFATYERMQMLYNDFNKLNKTMSQSYFSAVMKQPAIFFPKLAEMAVVYMSKIKSASYYKILLGNLSEEIGTSFPSKFNDDEKGQFILGYYQQQKSFEMFKPDDKVVNKDVANVNESKGE